MKQYKFEIIIFEGNDEFWEELEDRSGCDEVLDNVKSMLDAYGYFNSEVKLIEFTNK